MENPVILSFLMYILWIVLPMVPSVIIYRIFPDTKVGVTGVLANLKINATGAFAAYLIILVTAAFYWLGNVQALIPNASYQTWQVTAVLRYLDTEGHPLNNQDKYIERTNIQIVPFLQAKAPKEVKFLVTGQEKNITATFSSQEPGFTTATLDLQKDTLKIDGHNITALDTLTIEQLSSNEYSANGSLVSSQSGPPLNK